jgi:hypothetical protein
MQQNNLTNKQMANCSRPLDIIKKNYVFHRLTWLIWHPRLTDLKQKVFRLSPKDF